MIWVTFAGYLKNNPHYINNNSLVQNSVYIKNQNKFNIHLKKCNNFAETRSEVVYIILFTSCYTYYQFLTS